MAKFFRKLRQQTIGKGIGKYLLYALGEIALIIIGILIALTINNSNEKEKNDARVEAILLEIQHDLENDIQESSTLIQYYQIKDSLIRLVENKQVKSQDYQSKNLGLLGLTTTYQELLINDNGYQNLAQQIDHISAKYQPVFGELNTLYTNHRRNIELFNADIGVFTSNILKMRATKFPWFADLNRLIVTKDAINYLLNNPFYKNEVALYKTYTIDNFLPAIKRYRHQAIMSYLAISKLLNPTKQLPDFITTHITPIDKKILAKHVGTYQLNPNFRITVSLETDQLFIQATGQPKLKIYPKTEVKFFLSEIEASIIFQEDHAQKTVGLTLYQGSAVLSLEKIK